MKIKRFVAKNMREAIRQVREEQGADAVILSNRRVAGGIEVVAAVDYDAALMQQSLRREAESTTARANDTTDDDADDADIGMPTRATRPVAPPPREDAALAILFDDFKGMPHKFAPERVVHTAMQDAVPVTAVGEPAAVTNSEPPTASAGEQLAAAPSSLDQPVNTTALRSSTPATSLASAAVVGHEYQALKDEIGSLRLTLEHQLAGIAWNNMRQNQPQRYAVLRALSELGISPALAQTIANDMPATAGVERARYLPLGFLARRMTVTATDPILDGGIFALVGPTGVGKTTTIAKLAARYAEAHGTRDIALVAMDHYRIGAQEQLYTYGRLLGVTVHTVTQQQSLAATLAQLSDRALVLIDTVGMSPRDPALDAQIALLGDAHPRLQAFLMLAANSQAEDQAEVARRFGAARLAGCIISKLDETARIGGALSVAIQQQLPIAYFTDGQRVPEDLHRARVDSLVIRAMQLARQCPSPPDDEMLALMHEASLAFIGSSAAPGAHAHV